MNQTEYEELEARSKQLLRQKKFMDSLRCVFEGNLLDDIKKLSNQAKGS
jgi:hypothetical protein